MPLVLMCGLPCSGKSRIAEALREYAEKKGFKVQMIRETDMGWSRSVYSTMHEEKKARSAFMAAVERCLNKEDLVIADGMNYIKGYRYQLFCIARAIPTSYCVVYCESNQELVKEWNSARNSEFYDAKVLDELIMRFEEPLDKNRWESPLITIQAIDGDVPPPVEDIMDHLTGKKSKKNLAPPLSVVPKTLANDDLLRKIDQCTQSVIQIIMEAQKKGASIDEEIQILKTKSASDDQTKPKEFYSVPVRLPGRHVGLSELRRHRRQFIQINKIHRVFDGITESFIDYLNTALINGS